MPYPWHTQKEGSAPKVTAEEVEAVLKAGRDFLATGKYATCPPTGFATPQPERMTAEEILETARDLISGGRAEIHGPRDVNHKNIADLWCAFTGSWIPPYRVALMLALLKIARTKTGTLNMDDFIDAAGYIAIAGELAAKGTGEIK